MPRIDFLAAIRRRAVVKEHIASAMIDRQKLETVLSRRSQREQRPARVRCERDHGPEDEWEEVSTYDDFGYKIAPGQCLEACCLAREAQAGTEFRVLRRRTLVEA